MQSYVFEINDGTGCPDPDPVELASIEAAKREAVRFAGELLLDHVDHFSEAGRIDLRVSTDDGEEIIKISVCTTSEAASLSKLNAGREIRLAAVGGY